MNPQDIINAVGGISSFGQPSSVGGLAGAGMPQGMQPGMQPGAQPDMSMGGYQDNFTQSPVQGIQGGMSPVNFNPNYANTVGQFFEQNPLAGPQQFNINPVQSGQAGNNAARGGSGWGSFMGNDPHSIMQAVLNG